MAKAENYVADGLSTVRKSKPSPVEGLSRSAALSRAVDTKSKRVLLTRLGEAVDNREVTSRDLQRCLDAFDAGNRGKGFHLAPQGLAPEVLDFLGKARWHATRYDEPRLGGGLIPSEHAELIALREGWGFEPPTFLPEDGRVFDDDGNVVFDMAQWEIEGQSPWNPYDCALAIVGGWLKVAIRDKWIAIVPFRKFDVDGKLLFEKLPVGKTNFQMLDAPKSKWKTFFGTFCSQVWADVKGWGGASKPLVEALHKWAPDHLEVILEVQGPYEPGTITRFRREEKLPAGVYGPRRFLGTVEVEGSDRNGPSAGQVRAAGSIARAMLWQAINGPDKNTPADLNKMDNLGRAAWKAVGY